MNVLESLQSTSGYPIPCDTIESIAKVRGLVLASEADVQMQTSKEFRLAKADLMRWVSYAPNVSQQGISFDLLYSDRERMRKEANFIYGEYDDPAYQPESRVKYGYKGNRL